MFQNPGLREQENLKDEVREIRRWLNRFVPELEQQLDNLGADNFTTAYNERLEGITTLSGAGKSKTTSEAVAEHLLDYNNPHRVSLHQLGLALPAFSETDNGWALTFGGILLQCRIVEVTQHTGTARGNVYASDIALGDWDIEFSELMGTWVQAEAETAAIVWPGVMWGAGRISAGSTRLYCAGSTVPACSLVIYGLGRQ